MPFRRVLIALDERAPAAHAFEVGIDLLQALGAEAALVHVVDPKLIIAPEEGLPVGSSFSRSAINHLAGATSRWSGAITGLVVLAFLPLTGVLSRLPKAVLGTIVITAGFNLIRPRQLLGLWRNSHNLIPPYPR